MPRFPVPFLIVSLYLLIAGPTAAAERELSPPPFGEGYSIQSPRDVAWNGAEGFIVWSDLRAQFKTVAYGARIDADGRLLDRAGIPLYSGTDERTSAIGVAWTGDSWLTFWTDDAAIYVQRVSTLGQLVGPPHTVAVSELADYRLGFYGATVATAGDTTLVMFNITGARGAVVVSHDLQVIRPVDIGALWPFAIAAADDEYLLLALDTHARRSHMLRVSGSGDIIARVGAFSPSAGTKAAWTGRDFLTVWPSAGFLFGRRISADLTAVSDAFRIAEDQPAAVVRAVIDRGDGSAAVFWSSADKHLGTTVDGENRVSAPVVITAAGPETPIRPAPGGFVVLGDDLNLAWLDQELAPTDTDHLEVESFAAQHNVVAPRNGTADLVAFAEVTPHGATEPTRPATKIMIGRTGEQRAARPLFDSGRTEDAPAIASNGDGGIVVWFESRDGGAAELVALPITPRGAADAPAPVTVGPAFYWWATRWASQATYGGPVVAWTGQLYLVVWYRWDGSPRPVYARVLPDGTVLDPGGRPLTDARYRTIDLSIARAGDATFVVWSEDRQPCSVGICIFNPTYVVALRFSSDGQPVDPGPIVVAAETARAPDIASIGTIALVVWETAEGIAARRLTSGGFIYDAEPILLHRGRASRPAVARHEDRFVVVWQDDQTPFRYDANDLHGVTVGADGSVSQPFLVARETFQPEGPFAWTTTAGAAAVAYTRTSAATGMVPRLFYRIIGEPAAAVPPRVRAVRR